MESIPSRYLPFTLSHLLPPNTNKLFNNMNKCYMFLSITIVKHSNTFMFTYVLYLEKIRLDLEEQKEIGMQLG